MLDAWLNWVGSASSRRRKMGKISPVSSKYVVNATIDIDGVVDRPDVIGAIFGQTEGLLGSDLELRELQRSGRIGRIEVNLDTKLGKTNGKIIVPSSLDKAETSIIAAAIEIIQRIGPCTAKIRVQKIEDVRVSKRKMVIDRAKELLKQMTQSVLPDSQELADEVAYSVRMTEITNYGKDRLPAGPSIDESDDLIVVEGRADVLNLLKHGFKNVISMNGTSVPETIVELSKKKSVTAFVDGDRGGRLILKSLITVADLDYVTMAPDGKEVEEITKKELHKALRSRITAEQAVHEFKLGSEESAQDPRRRPPPRAPERVRPAPPRVQVVPTAVKSKFGSLMEDLIGTRGAYLLDRQLNILGKVPVAEMISTINSLGTIYAILFDGTIEKDVVTTAQKNNIRYLVGMDTQVRQSETSVTLLTAGSL